ncbi:uroporphyrinogen-III synthase [Candidatus Paracaedibacter symbiosus]|uniref:uroporphyrinogen-III synthase n=1 Tax=Candidatus Paracaedibacter symbiosus TaxID=244582 RepID=UPI0005099C65|nr:uroporphyrinogen-III synthase [Candidatus Paracaedibacter symbiosus]
MACILLTRPLDDAIEFEKNLHVPVLKAPLLEIELIPQPQTPTASDYTGLIVTSARSLMIFSEINSFLQKPIWCVGNKTALTAKKLGFETIYTAKNSAEELCQLIVNKTSPKAEKLLHICGESLHYDVVECLQKKGYHAEKIILYKTIPTPHFSQDVLTAFAANQIRIIPIFSRKTAEVLAKAIQLHKLESV